MPIAKEQVSHIARLAGLELSPSELAQYSRELTKIVEYIDRLKAADTSGVEISPLSTSHEALRDDVVRPSLPVNEALKNAPETKDNYFIVPRVM
jgi:aspartyl-tRNA(Asn)/glutamyl-tRNA(Gln) amidotransferase subunit C